MPCNPVVAAVGKAAAVDIPAADAAVGTLLAAVDMLPAVVETLLAEVGMLLAEVGTPVQRRHTGCIR